MKNIKNFNQYNNLNEGLGSWLSKKFNPGDLDHMLSLIKKGISKDLEKTNDENKVIKKGIWLYYNLDGEEIASNGIHIKISNEDITKYVNINVIIDFYNFLDNAYKNFEKYKQTNKDTEIRNKLWTKFRKYDFNDDDEYESTT